MNDSDDERTRDRDELIAEICTAFVEVTRGEHAISWSECVAIDNYRSDEDRAAARRSDKDGHWSELLDDPSWDPFPGTGGFCFINLEGFRYYLPPAMIRLLRNTSDEWFPGHLLVHINEWVRHPADAWWTKSQLRCIAKYIGFMARYDQHHSWVSAWKHRWRKHLTDASSSTDGG